MPRKPKLSSRLSEAPAAADKSDGDDLAPAVREDEGVGRAPRGVEGGGAEADVREDEGVGRAPRGVEVAGPEADVGGAAADVGDEVEADVGGAYVDDPDLRDGVEDATVFDELYAGEPPKYAVDTGGSERYAKRRTGEDYYITDEEGTPVLAKKRRRSGETTPFLATDGEGRPIDTEYSFVDGWGSPVFHVDPHGNERYLAVDGREVYPSNPLTGDQTYARDSTGRGYPARDAGGDEYYAMRKDPVSRDVVEYAPEGALLLDAATGKHRHPMNLSTGRPAFRVSEDGRERYFFEAGVGDVCATGPTGDVFYRRDAGGKELLPRNADGTSRYCRDAAGDEVYPKEDDGRTQYYMFDVVSMREIGARRAGAGFYYAKDQKGEKYPRLFELVTDAPKKRKRSGVAAAAEDEADDR